MIKKKAGRPNGIKNVKKQNKSTSSQVDANLMFFIVKKLTEIETRMDDSLGLNVELREIKEKSNDNFRKIIQLLEYNKNELSEKKEDDPCQQIIE